MLNIIKHKNNGKEKKPFFLGTVKGFTVAIVLFILIFPFIPPLLQYRDPYYIVVTLKYIFADTIIRRQGNRVLKYLEKGDINGIKKMLSEETKTTFNIDAQLTSANVFFKDRTISRGIESSSGSAGSYNICSGRHHIKNITTNEGKIYWLAIYSYIIYIDHPDREGVYCLVIREMTEDGKYEMLCTVGNPNSD